MTGMSVSELKPPIWVDRPQALSQMAERLQNFTSISVDTESNSLHAFREQVCLIQFSTTQEDYLVDPINLSDLSILGPLFSDPKIEKIFHAAEYDLICLRRDFQFQFANLFDTMMAGRILGRTAVGLGSMLEIEFAIRLDKRFQRANWAQRPLPPPLLAYARLDTHYLLPLRNRLYEELSASGRLELAAEDFRRMARIFSNGLVPEDEPTNGSEPVWRVSGVQDLSPQEVAILSELVAFREREARSANLPPFKIIGNQALVQIAQAAPQSREALRATGALSPRQADRYASGLLEAVRKGHSAPPMRRARSPRPDERYLNRLEALRDWRKRTAQGLGVESDVILPRDLLYQLAEQDPHQLGEVERTLELSPWRFQHYGPDILSTLQKSGG